MNKNVKLERVILDYNLVERLALIVTTLSRELNGGHPPFNMGASVFLNLTLVE